MSFEKAKADLEEKGLGDHVIVLNESSATVAEAAHALGVEPASIAKTLSVLQGEKPVLIVTEGTAKLDNHKYKSLFHIKAKMIPYDEVETYVGHAPGWSLEALEYIYKVRNAAANGHETLDTDSSAVAEEKGDLACERYVLDNDKLQVEVLANLDKVQPAGAVVIVSYPRIEGATGLPARVWAITE